MPGNVGIRREIWNFERNFAFLYIKTYKLVFKFGGLLAGKIIFFQAVAVVCNPADRVIDIGTSGI